MTTSKRRRQPSRRLVLGAIGVLVWLGVLFGVAIPAWRQAVNQHHQVQALESQLADLDRWTVAGLWLESSLASRRAVINPQWNRLFPAQAAKGEFFRDLARVADQSGVDDFDLRELIPTDGAQPTNAGGTSGTTALTAYRVRAKFQGHYAQVAEFLGGLKEIERAVSVHNLSIKPASGSVRVDLELDVYVSATNQS